MNPGIPEGDNSVYPDNVVPIRQTDMMFVFDANTPIVDGPAEERIFFRRYEAGLCRDCGKKRGGFTAFCEEHYPYAKSEWSRRRTSREERIR